MTKRPALRARAVITLVALALVSPLLTSCSEGPSMQPQEARAEIVAAVNSTTKAIGGDWKVRSGPGLGKCPAKSGGEGVTYVYIVDRVGPGDRNADLATAQKLWDERDITSKPYKSAGDDPILGLRGSGGPTSSIELLARSDGYSLTGVSVCADGDFDTMTSDDG